MKVKLDNTKVLKFPTLAQWGEWYRQWHGDMVSSLKGRYGVETAEDAVSAAFFKVIFGTDWNGSKFRDCELTEKGWFFKVRWQGKACLSHILSHEKVDRRHSDSALKERGETVEFNDDFDGDLESRALFATLYALPGRVGFGKDTVEMYRLCYLSDKDPSAVAKSFGKRNISSVYVARHRIEKALRKYGREIYMDKLRNLSSCAA